MIHNWRCCEGRSYITVHAVFIFSANKYIFLWILKKSFERFLAGPCQPHQLKAPLHQPFVSGPLTFPMGWSPHPVSQNTPLPALSAVSVSWWFLLASNSRRRASELSTSVHHWASALSPLSMYTATGDCPTTPINALPLSLTVFTTNYSFIPLFPSQFLHFCSLLVSLTAGQNQAITCNSHINLSCLK